MTPALSVVMLTRDRFERLLPALRRLAADADAGTVELVVVVPSAAQAGVDAGELESFGSHRVVEHGPLTVTGRALAAGFHAASAPVVAVLEDHVFVRPGWVSGVCKAHEGPWGSVGHAMRNANPESAISWADLMTNFGPVVSPVESGRDKPLGWHQTSYKRLPVLACGERLATLLETEGLLHGELAAAGHPTYLAADVEVAHANVESLRHLLRSALIGGRLFTACRASQTEMSTPRKAAWILAAPLVLALRARALARDLARVRTVRAVPPATLAYGALALVAHTAGGVVGYLRGHGDSAAEKAEYELNRAGYVGPGIMDPPPRAPSSRPSAPTSATPR